MRSQVALLLAESYRATGKLDAAAQQYAAAAGGFEGNVAVDIYFRLGVVQFAQGRYDDAIAAFDASLEIRGEGEEADRTRVYIGRAWIEKKDYSKAIEILQPLAKPSRARFALAPEGFATDQRFERAPVGMLAALWHGRVYLRQEKYDEAEKVLGNTIAGTLNQYGISHTLLTPDLIFDRANALMALGRFSEAASSFASLLRVPVKKLHDADYHLWPRVNDAMRLQAICLHRAKQYQQSLEAADTFLARFSTDPLAPEVRFVKAENLYLLKRLDEAAEAYSQLVSTNPQDANAGASTLRLGEIYRRQGREAEAVNVITQLTATQPEGEEYGQMNFIAGDSHFRLGQWDQAVAKLTTFLNAQNLPAKRDPRKPPPSEPNIDSALLELALAHVKLENPQAAMTGLKQLIELFDESVQRPRAMVELGRLQVEAGEVDAALQTLSGFPERYANHPQRPEAEYYLGWVVLKQGQLEKAEQHFAVVASSHAGHALGPDAALQLGLVQLSLDKFGEARDTFGRLLKTYPQHPRMDLAVFSFGSANARMERWQEAASYFQRVVEAFPKSERADDALYEWAWCEKGLKRNDEAAERYRVLIETYPDSDLRQKAETEMAELTYGAGEYDKAIAQLKQTLSGIEDPAAREPVLYRLGTAYFSKGDFESSAKTFEDFAEQYPNSGLLASALFQAGESRMKVKETARARDHFLAANGTAGLSPSLKESVLLRLGEVQGLTRLWRESSDAYEQLLQAFPESKWARHARYGMAWALEKQDRFPQAIDAYRAVIDPEAGDLISVRSQFQIGECFFALKQYDEAIRELAPVHTAYKYKDWAAKALLETGRIMEARGDKDGAIAQFKEVVSKFPDDDAAIVAKERLDELRREQ